MRSIYFAGLDLGQKQDPTALAVVEWAEYAGAWDAATFEYRKETSLSLRYLERIQLGTPYPEVVYRVGCMMRSRQLAGGESRHLVGTAREWVRRWWICYDGRICSRGCGR